MKAFGLAILSALLSIAVLPHLGFVWLAPVCLVPLLVALAGEVRPLRRALLGWAAGFVYWFGACYWIRHVLAQYGGMNVALVWLAFLLFCGLRALPWMAFGWLAGYVVHSRWAVLGVAALWTGLERVYGPFGFAWFVLGNAGIDMSVPLRLAPVTGVYGLSFVFAMLGAGVAVLILRKPRVHLVPLALLPLVLLLPAPPAAEPGTETAVVVQPNIEERADWTQQLTEDTIKRLTAQTLDVALAAKPAPRVILWPEVPAPFYYETDAFFRKQVAGVARATRTDFLFGGVAQTPRGAPLNSVFDLGVDGNFVARYDKINLVPFGEYTPSWFQWIGKISTEAGSFAPGAKILTFPIAGGRAGTFICYESVFPHFVRQFAAEGAGVLVNLSNDGYFGRSAAREQHLTIARMRAAENRRWLIRATNDGITAVIDPAGRVVQRLTAYGRVAARVQFDWRTDLSPYTRYGDWFVWGCLAAGLLSCVGRGMLQRR
ncbi:MAG TPA: apolipoprotein N-acyltransferase [Bryobacteraceae bacterium]|nr:apolipoprotein N-acyltransferase [Bryobacteraceae bacterium]